jgi:hypothetical protein
VFVCLLRLGLAERGNQPRVLSSPGIDVVYLDDPTEVRAPEPRRTSASTPPVEMDEFCGEHGSGPPAWDGAAKRGLSWSSRMRRSSLCLLEIRRWVRWLPNEACKAAAQHQHRDIYNRQPTERRSMSQRRIMWPEARNSCTYTCTHAHIVKIL